jgi:outer membrane protein OmpA-like peptidoglycan-associated protein
MGYDFKHVRIHNDDQADQLARSVNARAFTNANHLVFRFGEYQPDTATGRHLLAHELAHTVQQGASPSATPAIQRVCEVTTPPADMLCPPATSSFGTGTPILFGQDSFTITPFDLPTLWAIAAAWHTGGGVQVLRLDGFASCDGPASHNWRLSCNRAEAVRAELETPSDGSPGVDPAFIDIAANGETNVFSATSLSPNRRVMVSSGGTPPPGPVCPLTITGPTDVDHYCAAYTTPNDSASCPAFPAPSIVLTAVGAAPGATLTWRISRGTTQASIVGGITGTTVTIQGDAPSVAQGDVTVQVSDGTCTTTHFLTVRQPSSLTLAEAKTTTPTVVSDTVTYTVRDQFGNPMGANICWDETITQCRNSHSVPFAFGDAPTNASGQVTDNLNVSFPGGIPASLCVKLNQSITAGGCGPLLNNTILFRPTGVTLTSGASCVVGDPCP